MREKYPQRKRWCRSCGEVRFHVMLRKLENRDIVKRWRCLVCGTMTEYTDKEGR